MFVPYDELQITRRMCDVYVTICVLDNSIEQDVLMNLINASWYMALRKINHGSVFTKRCVAAKLPVRFFKSRPYWTGVTAAMLRRHLSNMNVIL